MKTLFCHQGQDNPLRFVAIQAGGLLASLVIISLFLALPLVAPYVALAVALLLYPVLKESAWRRGRDARLTGWPVVAPVATSMVLLVALPYLTMTVFIIMALVWLLATAQLAIRPGKGDGDAMVGGYCGPMMANDRGDALYSRRVEPSLIGGEALETPPSVTAAVQDELPDAHQLYLTLWRRSLGALLKLPLALKAAVALLLVTAMLVPWVGQLNWETEQSSDSVSQPEVAPKPEVVKPRAEAILEMPDQYWLWLDNGTLSVRWQGDDAPVGELWSLETAKGDTSCAELVFNDDSAYRPYRVDVEADGFYLATFSPMDTEILIRQIARRGSFKLCGYPFSLKGSTKALKSHSHFEWFLTR
ncbi:hypothetical protein [Ferrimonas sp. SCSIO 43195]|uniref:hypothetical protein n=1 Tax=Ferrimonas sp. SCSIO 43195 TaxID=2822844 RepID=UPI002075EAB9|nr:hypothetical protein [Ferrimonas sp. SCSIO 43195]USD35757.1 hypothetical protein J8Z22_11940 [Ferrimonas sp. SCSIO 43195]